MGLTGSLVCLHCLVCFCPTRVQWKEAEEKELHLESEKRASALSDASRKWFLKQETSAALEHGDLLCEEVPWLQREHMTSNYLPQTSQLNGVSEMDSATQTFSSRKTTEWSHMEHDLLKKVRTLRQRLTAQARNRCQPPHLLVT